MNDAGNVWVFLENGIGVIVNTKINLVVLYCFACYFFNSFQDVLIAAAVVISRHNVKSILNKINYGMCANIAAATGYQYFLHIQRNKKNHSRYRVIFLDITEICFTGKNVSGNKLPLPVNRLPGWLKPRPIADLQLHPTLLRLTFWWPLHQ